jgi:hypothetical protein
MASVKSYKGQHFESSCCRTEQYAEFERTCKRELKKQCAKLGINIHKFYPNHFEWSAVLEKGGKFVYVSMSDVRYWDWYNDILIRTMAHAEDWRGGSNNSCSFDKIGEMANRLLGFIPLSEYLSND